MSDHLVASNVAELDYAEQMPTKPFRYGVMEAKKRIQEAQRGRFFFTTGLATLDKYIRLRPKTYTVIAAESGVGKTALALQIAAHVEAMKREWNDRRKTLIFSAEMASAELAQRIAAARTGISVWDQEGGDLTAEQETLLYDTLDDIADDTPFQIDDDASPDHSHVFNSCSIVAEAGGLACVILDYVELAVSDERFKAEHVRAVAKMLKTVSKEFGVPTIGISQVNKDNKTRANKRPEMTDLRYGGHEPADAVVILQRCEDIVTNGDFEALRGWVVKNRGGKRGHADLLFDGPKTTFYAGDFSRMDLND